MYSAFTIHFLNATKRHFLAGISKVALKLFKKVIMIRTANQIVSETCLFHHVIEKSHFINKENI